MRIDDISCEVISTGLEHMKILLVASGNGGAHEFFLDVSDGRFPVLHQITSEDPGRIVASLTKSYQHAFDNTWFYPDMLKRLAAKTGGDEGSSPSDFVLDDVHNTGYFAAKRGRSARDHLWLVDVCKKEYSETVDDVENLCIGTREECGRTLAGGRSFDFEFPNKIEDLDAFVRKMFSPAMPFKLWGPKSGIHDGYVRVTAVDLHTGSPMDFEVADDMMRAYLFKGGCGNTVLRLFSCLRALCDSGVRCGQIR